MTPEQMRIAVAEACGWTELRQSKPWEFSDDPDNRVVLCGYWPAPQGGGVSAAIHNYPADLNACAEMVAALSGDEREKFAFYLAYQKYAWFKESPEDYTSLEYVGYIEQHALSAFVTQNATAPERCEAFLRVKGLWKDDPKP